MKIRLIGLGMGHPGTITAAAREALASADAVLGAKRLLESLPEDCTATRIILYRPPEILTWLEEHPDLAQICVVYSGDIGFYSGAIQLIPRLEKAGYRVEGLPGLSTVPYFCARLGIPWQDLHLASAHGTRCDVLAHVLNHERCLFLTGGQVTPASLCRELVAAGLGDTAVTVGERLSYPEEKIRSATAAVLAEEAFDSLSTVLTRRVRPAFCRDARSAGIPDHAFHRDKVPMTKQEVRAAAMAKLTVKEQDIVWDVGAGTGSVSVEAALLARWGRVYAIENNPTALALIRQNREAFGAYNLIPVEGTAPVVLKSLPTPDAVFVGGSKGRLGDILRAAADRNPSVRIVVAAVTLETATTALQVLEELQLADVEAVQVAVTRAERAGGSRLLRAQNPVFLVSAGGGQ